MNFRYRLMQFMSGRYGQDEMFFILFGVSVLLSVINMFLRSLLLQLAVYAFVIYALFRFFSRNIEKRRKENRAVLSFVNRFKQRRELANQRKNDKCHVYKKCTGCKAVLRLPHRLGVHKTVCPKCGKELTVKVKK